MLLNRSSNECYHFDDKNVRIYIIDGKDRYYIDKTGWCHMAFKIMSYALIIKLMKIP
ncbi:hypothetical protein BANRA_04746 [Escherichia coli]|nr:hypothetical protein BANRA_04746 [Escherichia coli]